MFQVLCGYYSKFPFHLQDVKPPVIRMGRRRFICQIRLGRNPWNRLRMKVKIRIVAPATKPPIVQPRMVSTSFRWKNRETAQKPESFGRESPMLPAHTATAHRMGDTVEAVAALATIAAVVVNATVVEPVAMRSTWAMA